MAEYASAFASTVGGHSTLIARPDRSWWWVFRNTVQGTWFLVLVHLGALAVLLTGATTTDLIVAAMFLPLRGLITTVGYHRFFAHRSYKTSRTFQFILGCLCCTNLQRGPIYWSNIHRRHHRHSDDAEDIHSPIRGGFWWSYFTWMFASLEKPDDDLVKDLTRYAELVWLERLWLLPALLMVAVFWLCGGWSMVCVAYCLPVVVALHGASFVNSVSHLVGSRRYPTRDQSRNSFWVAMLTFGDGWHNNHHHYPHAAQAGFFWWEIDGSFRFIRLLERLGIVWDVRRVPAHKLDPNSTRHLPPKSDSQVLTPIYGANETAQEKRKAA